jgi:tRNA A37 N6-isopentenylltransferase MiaA
MNIPIDNKNSIDEKYDSEILHGLLKMVDPKMGEYLHSNDKRRIVNALFKYFKYLPQTQGEVKESEIQKLK